MSTLRLALAGVCLLAAAVYANSLANGFALDDRSIIEDNPEVHGIRALPEAITGPYWPQGPRASGLYRPLTLATYAINWELADAHPFGFHLVNVLLHVAVTALLLLLLLRLGVGLLAATVAAAVFAVHPVHVEAVANVVGRAEVLATLFFLLACLAYVRIREGWPGALLIGALYLLSLLSKEIGVSLPGALVLLHFVDGRSIRGGLAAAGRRWRTYMVLALALASYFLLREANIGTMTGAGASPWFWGEPTGTRIWTAVRVFPEYLRLMLVPVDLVPDYGPGVIVPERSWANPLVLLGMLTALMAALVTVLAWNRVRLLSLGILWFAGTVFPVSNVVIPTGILLAERTLYLPSIGLSLGLAGLVMVTLPALRRERRSLRLATVGMVLLLLLAGYRTWEHNKVWRDHESVARYLVRTHPANFRAQWLLAVGLKEQGDTAAAMNHLQLALRMVPGYYNLRAQYARELFEQGRYDAAAAQFDTARHVSPEIETAHVRYLEILFLQARYEEAAEAALEVVDRFPGRAVPYHIRAQALARLGRWEEAREARTRALALDRGDARWAQWLHLAAIETGAGRAQAAAAALDSARTAAPEPGEVPALEELERRLAAGEPGIPFW